VSNLFIAGLAQLRHGVFSLVVAHFDKRHARAAFPAAIQDSWQLNSPANYLFIPSFLGFLFLGGSC